MKAKAGKIYFIRCGEFVKIGFATDVPTRFSGIKTSTPHELELLGTVPGDRSTERAFHERFKRHHHRGEWFHFADEIKGTIARLGIFLVAPKKAVADELEDPYFAGIEKASRRGFR
jgi:hypothetical protein